MGQGASSPCLTQSYSTKVPQMWSVATWGPGLAALCGERQGKDGLQDPAESGGGAQAWLTTALHMQTLIHDR